MRGRMAGESPSRPPVEETPFWRFVPSGHPHLGWPLVRIVLERTGLVGEKREFGGQGTEDVMLVFNSKLFFSNELGISEGSVLFSRFRWRIEWAHSATSF